MKKLLCFALVLIICAPVQAEELVARTVLNGKVNIMLPKSFSIMSKKMLETKYSRGERPTEAFSNAKGTVSVAFNHTQTPLKQSQMKEAHASISDVFHKTFPNAKWIRDEVFTMNGKHFFVLELIVQAADTKIHNIFYGTSASGKFLIVSFNATSGEAKKWIPVGKKVMNSISTN